VTKNKLIYSSSRRNFIYGLLAGAAITSVPFYLKEFQLDSGGKNEFRLPNDGGNGLPELNYYPITHVDELYIVYNRVFQEIVPRLRQSPYFQENEYQIFKVLTSNNFFLLANEYIVRLREHFKDDALFLPNDRKIGGMILSQSIQSYPEAWAKIIHAAITFNPKITKDFLMQGGE
jgi:hypothetical protein